MAVDGCGNGIWTTESPEVCHATVVVEEGMIEAARGKRGADNLSGLVNIIGHREVATECSQILQFPVTVEKGMNGNIIGPGSRHRRKSDHLTIVIKIPRRGTHACQRPQIDESPAVVEGGIAVAQLEPDGVAPVVDLDAAERPDRASRTEVGHVAPALEEQVIL